MAAERDAPEASSCHATVRLLPNARGFDLDTRALAGVRGRLGPE